MLHLETSCSISTHSVFSVTILETCGSGKKKISVLSRRITGKWHLVWGFRESGPAESWSGTVGAISVFGYQWGTLTTVPQTIYSCGVSKRNILIFPPPDHLFHPLCALPALCWHKCLCSHAVNPPGELTKITLFLSLSLLAPLTLVSSPGMRGEQNHSSGSNTSF